MHVFDKYTNTAYTSFSSNTVQDSAKVLTHFDMTTIPTGTRWLVGKAKSGLEQ